MSNAHKTAITRKKPSVPVRRLKQCRLIVGRVLDYGCGRGADTDYLGCEGYDPHYVPRIPVGPFDTVVCNYVLNVIESDAERRVVLRDIANLLARDGVAYITVRANKKDLKGTTSKGTWQGLIMLDLPIVYTRGDYVTYQFYKGDADCKMTAETF